MQNSAEKLDKLRKLNHLLAEQDTELATEAADLRSTESNLEVARAPDSVDVSIDLESITHRRLRPVLSIRDDTTVLDFDNETDSALWKQRISDAAPVLDPVIPSVGRINLENTGFEWVGSGWLIRDSIIVTNRHVADVFVQQSDESYSFTVGDQGTIHADVDFLQELDNPQTRSFRLVRPLHIVPSPGPDIAFFEVEQTDGGLATPIALAMTPRTTRLAATIGYPAFDSRIPEIDLMQRIFGHRYNKKCLAPGCVSGLQDVRLLHNCTTLGGNSGSAVIDLETGEVLGLHFSGAFMVSNYAVRSDIVERALQDALSGRQSSFSTRRQYGRGDKTADLRAAQHHASHSIAADQRSTQKSVSVTIPLTISVSIGQPFSGTTVDVASVSADMTPLSGDHAGDHADDDVVEDITEARPEDYRDRAGYQSAFLGHDKASVVPLPTVVEAPGRILSFSVDGNTETELKYQHFSVVMNRDRRLCFFSAVNIDGSKVQKLPRGGWKFDPRIPEEFQIKKECYGNPPRFSRGHMTRRNDPSWGDGDTARRGDRDTMHVTNAAPQMQAFNSPIWLELEDYALDNAIQDDMKISVFTGPYFAPDDKAFYGVQVPVKFWKIIAFMHDDTGQLSATGYEMDQTASLPTQDEFVFGGFTNRQGVATQVPIRSIETNSGLSFHGLADRDPLSTQENTGAVPIRLTSRHHIRFT